MIGTSRPRHARLVLAHEAHATIRAVRVEAAEALPAVVAVLTAAELPLVGAYRAPASPPAAFAVES